MNMSISIGDFRLCARWVTALLLDVELCSGVWYTVYMSGDSRGNMRVVHEAIFFHQIKYKKLKMVEVSNVQIGDLR